VSNTKETALKELEKAKRAAEKAGFSVTGIIKKQYNYEFSATKNGGKFKVQFYFGKKGLRKVVQGNTLTPEYRELRDLATETIELFNEKEEGKEPSKYIGTDESGKGDIFGPLVVAAVYSDELVRLRLRAAGVRDSKEINNTEIESLAKKIPELTDNKFVVLSLSPEEYNKRYKEFGNLNKMLNWLHSEAIKELLKKVECDVVITDKFSNAELDLAFESGYGKIRFLQYQKAEKFTGVAAASVLARAEMQKWFKKNKYKGKMLPKGASEKAEKFLGEILKSSEKNELVKYAKLHFKSFNKF